MVATKWTDMLFLKSENPRLTNAGDKAIGRPARCRRTD